MHSIGKWGGAYKDVLMALKKNRKMLICDYKIPYYLQTCIKKIGLSGDEKRPFTDRELDQMVRFFSFFNKIFTDEGLLPIERLES